MARKQLLTNLDNIKAQKDTYLLPENIKKGITVYNIEGTLEASTITEDATATASDIKLNKTAYVNNEKIVGSMPVLQSYTQLAVTNMYASDNEVVIRNDTSSDLCLEPNGGLTVSSGIVLNAIRLTPDILKEGSTILGMTGSLDPGVDTSDGTATSNDILLGKKAYVKDLPVIGTIETISSILIEPSELILNKTTTGIDINTTLTERVLLDNPTDLSLSLNNSQIVDLIKLQSSQIVQGNTILGVTGTAEIIPNNTKRILYNTTFNVALSDITTMSNYIQFSFSDPQYMLVNPNIKLTSLVSKTDLSGFLGIIPNVIKSGIEILGVTGTYVGEAGTGTEDATATALDIVEGKTAYINKTKVTGLVPKIEASTLTLNVNSITPVTDSHNNITYEILSKDNSSYTYGILLKNSNVKTIVTEAQLAEAIGLTSNMLAEGVTLLGITGNYTGNGVLTQTEYDEIEALADQVLAEEEVT